MKQICLLLTFAFISILSYSQPVFISKSGQISFFSKAPMEDIEAHNKSVQGFININSKEFQFRAVIRQFEFEKQLMKEHFNENYLESDKYPDATYKGKINESVDLSKDGVYQVTATGVLKMHGVEQTRTEKGTLTVKGKTIELHAEMKVKVADFKIEIPKLVFQNIAETVDVKVDIPFTPFVKEEKK